MSLINLSLPFKRQKRRQSLLLMATLISYPPFTLSGYTGYHKQDFLHFWPLTGTPYLQSLGETSMPCNRSLKSKDDINQLSRYNSLVGCHPVQLKVAMSIPGQGTCPDFSRECAGGSGSVFHSPTDVPLSFFLPSFLSKN